MINIELLNIILPALAAGFIISITHAPLGIVVLKRGIIFIDLAVAQVASLGIIFALTFFHNDNAIIKQIIALGFALLAGLLFSYTEKNFKKQQEAIIGVFFVLSASVIILLLANNPHGLEHIENILSGQLLFVTWKTLIYHIPIYAVILFLWFLYPKVRKGIGFYTIFAFAITSSVQLAGIYLVFASLIMPALAVVKMKKKSLLAVLLGIISIVTGLITSLFTNMPSGPVIVCTYVLICSIVFLYTNKIKTN